mmetsp:Transcript_11489/g.70642  ORF Transcript_11489/g.70642 Transcript_11489/m.70642 type:complete len:260 (+) Transcript_11489:1518-2297(+)
MAHARRGASIYRRRASGLLFLSPSPSERRVVGNLHFEPPVERFGLLEPFQEDVVQIILGRGRVFPQILGCFCVRLGRPRVLQHGLLLGVTKERIPVPSEDPAPHRRVTVDLRTTFAHGTEDGAGQRFPHHRPWFVGHGCTQVVLHGECDGFFFFWIWILLVCVPTVSAEDASIRVSWKVSWSIVAQVPFVDPLQSGRTLPQRGRTMALHHAFRGTIRPSAFVSSSSFFPSKHAFRRVVRADARVCTSLFPFLGSFGSVR